ncbi:hypothetical protein BJY59DRAFT_656470 [Rhodotorula toruloides]
MGNSASVLSAHERSAPPSASLVVGSKSTIGMGRYWVGRLASGRLAAGGECRGERRVADEDHVGGGWCGGACQRRRGGWKGARREGEKGVFSVSAEGEGASLTRASTPLDFAGARSNGAEIVSCGPIDGEVGQVGREDGFEGVRGRRGGCSGCNRQFALVPDE